MKEPVRIGLIGVGGIAQSYLQVFRNLEKEARLVAVADVRGGQADAAAKAMGCRGYDSHSALVEGEDVEAVLICTPPATHPEIAAHFLERGISVLSEKPLATDVGSAEMLLKTAESNGVILTMSSKYRYVDEVVRAKSILASGILGEIILLENVFATRVEMSRRWNSDPRISGGGVLVDNGTHSVDLIRYLLGPIVEVAAVEGKRVQGLAVEDTVQLFVKTADGVRGTVDLSWSIDKQRDPYIDIYGSNGTVSVGWKVSRFRQAASPDWVVFGGAYDKIGCLGAQLQNFCRAVRNEEQLLITAEDAIASIEVIQKAYASLARPRWVRVEGAHRDGGRGGVHARARSA